MVNGKAVKVVYGQDYPAFGRQRSDPEVDAFYRALLEFTLYWEMQLSDCATAALPEKSWVDMSMHAFARELIVRPGGVYPKYGAVDRYYTGSEYDGFQDTFTSALYSNLEWGRFEMAGQVFDNYFSNFVDRKGMVDMRGPETAQFGMTLSLIAKYFNYTRDKTLLLKHKGKIEATAALLIALHDESLQLPQTDPGYGLIHGWCESDSCFQSQPMAYWRPYFANSAFAARGLRDIAYAWATLGWDKIDTKTAKSLNEWLIRSQQLSSATIASIRKNILRDKNPPYIATLPGTGLTFRESLETEHPSLQQWPQRAYSELLQADVLPADLANLVIDCMRAYGGTTLGVVGDVWSPAPQGRVILGFVSYGYALALLRLDRIEEYLLFLYAHRFHAHTRGSWTAAETAHLTGETFLFCMPAQHTIPLLVRWMLVLEDSDADRLYLARGLPRDWLDSGKEIKIVGAPTRWGRVNLRMIAMGGNRVAATVDLASADGPRELHVKFRLPTRNHLHTATVNGLPARFSGPHNDIVIISVQNQRHFEVIAQFV
jgi:hypothetical protein